MKTSSRFAVAVHILTLAMLARAETEGGLVTSERMADSVNTNPVVVRRILGALRKAGLVTSQAGPHGGWRLARSPEQMTLLDVYHALEDDPIFALPQNPPSPSCVVGRHVPVVLGTVFAEAQKAMEGKLAEVTVAAVIDEVVAKLAACRRL